MKSNNLAELKKFRRELRTHGTPAEAFLWSRLKNKQVEGLQFRRQFSVDCFILDFYCPELRLAIELDGEVHKTQEEYDRARTQYLHDRHGIKVLRFENRVVFEQLYNVIAEIREAKAEAELRVSSSLHTPQSAASC